MANDITSIDVERIAQLGRDAHGFELLNFTPPKEAKGLVPFNFGFDRRSNVSGSGIKSLKDEAERWRIHPERKIGTANVSTLTSFSDLVNRHKTEHSVIFARTLWPDPSLTAVIDYHEVDPVLGTPQFGRHRVHYPFPVTEELKAWMGQDTEVMTQHDFAVFVEERIAEIAEASDQEKGEFEALFRTKFGTPAEIMELSRGLEVAVASAVKQHNVLQSGERQIMFSDDHATKVTVPGLFMVSVPAFLDGIAVRLPARLRYRVTSQGIVWFYQLYRCDELLRGRVLDDLAKVKAETQLPVFEGAPEQ
jgi:uncharacterized protein YfdQ (DUF2303 family)